MEFQKKEPTRNPALPVSTETFKFFTTLLLIRLPNDEKERFLSVHLFFFHMSCFRMRTCSFELFAREWNQFSFNAYNYLQAEVRKLVTKKVRKISRVLHPDKCRFKQSPWSESSQDALAFINKGTK